MTDTLKVGVIGAGYWGPNLIRNFNDAPLSDVLAVADLQPQRLAPIRKRYPGIRMTSDHRSILDDPRVEAVAIATPISTHRPLAIEAFAAGKHVLVEKPLAGTIADAEAIVAAARAARRTLMVGHTFVHNPAVSAVRGIIERGDLGEIHYIDSQRVNLGLHQFDFNVLWDLGPHDVSITLYWLDQEPLWVQCVGGCYVQDDIEDVAWLTIGFPSGAIAHAHLSWLAPGKIRTMTVIGSRKMAMYDDLMPVEKVKIFDQGVERLDPDELRRAYRAGDIHSPRVPMTEALQIEVTRFVESVRTGTPSISDGEAGLRVVRVLEAASRSLRAQGARVEYEARREAVATAAP